MPTRRQEANSWQAISLNSRKAAQRLLEAECYRSCVSRSYYAAYAAITSALIRQGITLGYGGNNPGHAGLPVYILNNLTLLPMTVRFEINRSLRRLYASRIEADYIAARLADREVAVNSLRDLRHVLLLLGIPLKEANQ